MQLNLIVDLLHGRKIFDEIVPVSVSQGEGEDLVVSEDEEYQNVKLNKIPVLRAVFDKEELLRSKLSSTLNDGSCISFNEFR